jgi:hypothetical protein
MKALNILSVASRIGSFVKVISLLGFMTISLESNTQTSDSLMQLKGYPFDAFYSPRYEEKAKGTATRCDHALNYMYQKVLGFKPTIKVFVLNPEHWKKYASTPLYGMPHITENEQLIVAAEDNAFWKSFIPPIESLSPEMAKTIQKLYSTNNGDLSMEPFFELLSLHELGHLFSLQGSVNFPRKWMDELFASTFLHTYIAENEPKLLSVLGTFPKMVVEKGTKGFKHTSLEDFELFYGEKMNPNNYGWYQCKLGISAKQIYEAGGINVLKSMWTTFLNNSQNYSDKELLDFLKSKIPEIAKVLIEWQNVK